MAERLVFLIGKDPATSHGGDMTMFRTMRAIASERYLTEVMCLSDRPDLVEPDTTRIPKPPIRLPMLAVRSLTRRRSRCNTIRHRRAPRRATGVHGRPVRRRTQLHGRVLPAGHGQGARARPPGQHRCCRVERLAAHAPTDRTNRGSSPAPRRAACCTSGALSWRVRPLGDGRLSGVSGSTRTGCRSPCRQPPRCASRRRRHDWCCSATVTGVRTRRRPRR